MNPMEISPCLTAGSELKTGAQCAEAAAEPLVTHRLIVALSFWC